MEISFASIPDIVKMLADMAAVPKSDSFVISSRANIIRLDVRHCFKKEDIKRTFGNLLYFRNESRIFFSESPVESLRGMSVDIIIVDTKTPLIESIAGPCLSKKKGKLVYIR